MKKTIKNVQNNITSAKSGHGAVLSRLIPSALAFASVSANAKVPDTSPGIESIPEPSVVFRVDDLKKNETAVDIKIAQEILEDNGLCRKVETTLIFTNPNSRAFAGELEFPLPDGAAVCGYVLEVNGIMVPGVICEKEKARVAFENEMRKGVDPGIVENVKGNIWRTRIYPLMPNKPRMAKVSYVIGNEEPKVQKIYERDGDDVFLGEFAGNDVKTMSVADRIRGATSCMILWDASFSRQGNIAADRNLLECLPEKGDWTLVIFRDVPEEPRKFYSRSELLKEIDKAVYDGGTGFANLAEVLGKGDKFIFTDEMDTLSVQAPDFENDPSIVFASRPPAKDRRISVRKLNKNEKISGEIKESKLLATVWAANRIADLAAQSGQRKSEFLELGRKYGIAGPDTSLIVLDSLDQYLKYKIEPPKEMPFYAEWKRCRAAQDDEIDLEDERTGHRKYLLTLWKERIEWWKNPIPQKKTPKSGLFDLMENTDDAAPVPMSAMAMEMPEQIERRASVIRECRLGSGDIAGSARTAGIRACAFRGPVSKSIAECAGEDGKPVAGGADATVKIAAWDPKMPYLDALKKADKKNAYAEYLKQRTTYGTSPAFFLDCAGWFFKNHELNLGCRIISNLAEMKLEDVCLWRTMGWRLREAGAYDFAVDVFRHVLSIRGEEIQSKRDLALVLTERGKLLFAAEKTDAAKKNLEEAANLLFSAAFDGSGRRSARRSNDMQTSIVSLEDLNGLISWADAKRLPLRMPKLEKAFRRDMPLDLRIVMSWDTDETDIDIHVLEPDGEEAYYGHRRTSSGGFVSEDVTTGYGPEEYLKKVAEKGVYKVLSNYYASHQQQLTGATVVTATVYTGWGTKNEKSQILSFRLDKARDKHPIGEIEIK